MACWVKCFHFKPSFFKAKYFLVKCLLLSNFYNLSSLSSIFFVFPCLFTLFPNHHNLVQIDVVTRLMTSEGIECSRFCLGFAWIVLCSIYSFYSLLDKNFFFFLLLNGRICEFGSQHWKDLGIAFVSFLWLRISLGWWWPLNVNLKLVRQMS